MSTTQVSPPAELAVSMADVAASLRMEVADLADVQSALNLAVAAITQEAEHMIQRSLVNRGMRVTLDSFPCDGAIRLDRGPVSASVTVKFRDLAGAWQTLDPQDYEVDNATVPGWVVPAVGKSWPATAQRLNSITVDYTAGYGPDDTTVPECARQYILLRLADVWDPAGRKFGETAASVFADGLLDQLRVY